MLFSYFCYFDNIYLLYCIFYIYFLYYYFCFYVNLCELYLLYFIVNILCKLIQLLYYIKILCYLFIVYILCCFDRLFSCLSYVNNEKKKKIGNKCFFVFYSFNFRSQLPFKIKQKFLLCKILKYKIVTYYVNYFKILSKKQYFNKIVNIINIILITFPRVLQNYVN